MQRLTLATSLIVAGAAVLALGAGGGSAAPKASGAAKESLTIYVVGYEQQGAFWQVEGRGAKQAGKDFGVKVVYAAPPTASDQGVIQLLSSAIAAKPAGICINYTGKVMEAPTLRALNSGAKVVLYNNNRFEAQSGGATTNPKITDLAFVGQDEHRSGEVLGNAFAKNLKKGDKVLVLNPFPQAFVLTLRYQGVKRALAAHGITTTLLVVGADEGRNQQIISSYLQAHSDIDGIVGLGTPAANPAARAVASRGKKMPVATFDIDSGAYDLIKAGRLTMALNQQPFLQAYYCVQNLVFNLRYGFQPVNVNTGTFIVTKKNLNIVAQLIKAGRG